jgi:hypothetical protein
MASTTEAHSVSAKAVSDQTADSRNNPSGTYGIESTDKNQEEDGQIWARQVNDE